MKIFTYFEESASTKMKFIKENKVVLCKAIKKIASSLKKWNKILIAWNGGSAADAQHIAAEFIWRYKCERKSIPAIALTTDTSIITAISNDYSFNDIFKKQIEWLWQRWDIFIAISTSWNSENIIRAIKEAKERKLVIIWLTWNDWGKIKDLAHININVESRNTPRIQETHMVIYHTICEEVEKLLI